MGNIKVFAVRSANIIPVASDPFACGARPLIKRRAVEWPNDRKPQVVHIDEVKEKAGTSWILVNSVLCLVAFAALSLAFCVSQF